MERPEFSKLRIQQEIAAQVPSLDGVRRSYLAKLAKLTGRTVVLYAMKSPFGSIESGDLEGFMCALQGMTNPQLDLVIYSPGGNVDAAEQVANYLRAKFQFIRAIVPLHAFSAATMLACAADEIVMGKQSALGPIDPQFLTSQGSIPAHAIIKEFDSAIEAVKADPNAASFWVPRLHNLPHGFYHTAKQAIDRSKILVGQWLATYMKLRSEEAIAVAEWLASPDHLSHGRPISLTEAREKGLNVSALEESQDLQDLVLAVFHATMLTFESTRCIKFVENHCGIGSYFFQPQVVPQVPQPSSPRSFDGTFLALAMMGRDQKARQ